MKMKLSIFAILLISLCGLCEIQGKSLEREVSPRLVFGDVDSLFCKPCIGCQHTKPRCCGECRFGHCLGHCVGWRADKSIQDMPAEENIREE